MKSKKLFNILLIVFFHQNCFGLERIENLEIDRKKVTPIIMAFKRATVIEFKDPVEKVRLGAEDFYAYEVDETKPTELAIIRKNNIDVASNIIVRTTSGEIFVFDLVPSKINHRAVAYIDSSYYGHKSQTTIKNKKSKRQRVFSGRKTKIGAAK